MMKKSSYLVLFCFLVISCNTNDVNETNNPSEEFEVLQNSEFGNAISFNESGVIGVTNATTNRAMEPAWIFGIEQIAMVEPPLIGGVAARATHVAVKDNYAYISYNKEGETYLGGIDIVDVSNQYNPVLISRMITDKADVNALFVDAENAIYFTGATAQGENGNRSLLGKVETSNGEFTSDFMVNYGLIGYAGVDIVNLNNAPVIISGINGAAGSYNFTGAENIFELKSESLLGDLRSAVVQNGKLVVLSGEEGLLSFQETGGVLEVVNSISTEVMTPEAQRSISAFEGNILVPEGIEGAGIYNFDLGERLISLPLNIHPDAAMIDNEDRVTNTVSYDGNFIYMANGGAGLDILKLDTELNTLAEGIAEISGSANYVMAANEYIYVASGTGLKILKINVIAEDIVESEFMVCTDLEEYTGNKNFTVNPNEEFSFGGVMNIKTLNVNGGLDFCGEMNIEKSANISSEPGFNMRGTLRLGNNKSTENLVITSKSIMRMEGTMVIYGDLTINSNGTLEFIGEDSKLIVFGEVKINNGGNLIGTVEDVNSKL
ncbi:hypothetical protein [Gramella sp. AN32]|uniref:LVIVD repeat-containing protein n=1 Tax=Christiangramia antarctica TaxID=2058158 RepID=A0ABW5X1S4_9FLAO|nr:hypothetical protein [Gramella sp. AN32]MCM4154880.1 hypothetical protein [Gramella sp. AN32]